MAPQLPANLDRYFTAQNAHNIDAMVACFAPDAVVHDEGHTYSGREAIRAWKIDTSIRYRITATPLESRREGDRTIIIVNVAGAFPGSPVNLTYQFGLATDGRITALEVR